MTCNATRLAASLPVAQWLENPTGVRKVMGSIPVGDSDFFFVPRSWRTEYSILFSFFTQLKIYEIFPHGENLVRKLPSFHSRAFSRKE